jgi:hypothetical protein
MTQMLDRPLDGGFDDVPLLTAGAALQRATAQPRRLHVPGGIDVDVLVNDAPAAGLPPGDLPTPAMAPVTPLPPPVAERASAPAEVGDGPADERRDDPAPAGRRGPAGFMRAAAATAVTLVACAGVAAAAVFLTFPHAASLSHLSQRDITWLIPAGALAAAIAAVAAWRAAQRVLRNHHAEDIATVTGAIVATVTSATGMWTFFATYVPTMSAESRSFVFAFLEIFTFAEGLRARRNMRDFRSAGVDGAAMWVGAGISAFLSSLASTTVAEALFRLVPPLAAAWMWERTLVTERRRTREHRPRQINWRISPERVLVRLGLAEPTGRTLGDVAAQRRITQVALAAERAAILDAGGASLRRRDHADRRLRSALRMAVEHAGLATDEQRQQQLISQLAILRGYQELTALAPPTPWTHLVQTDGERKQRPDRRRERRQDRKPETGDERPKGERPGDERRESNGGGAFSGLADELTRSLRQGDDGGTARIHSLLSGRTDYEDFVRWLGNRGKFGDKRLMALAALYATGDLASPGAVSNWIAGLVPGKPGHVEKADIRRIRDRIEPEWRAANHRAAPPSSGGGPDNEQESR